MNFIRKSLYALFTAFLLICSSALAVAEEVQPASEEVAAAVVNLNTASAEELAEKLDGIGSTRAEMIVKYREEKGPFTSVEQLLEIKGIGAATLEKNRNRIQL